MKAIAGKRRRFGYRRIGVLLERKGMTMNHKELYRLYTEENWGSGGEEVANLRVDHAHQCQGHLVKLAATIIEKKTRIVMTLPASCPRQNLIKLLFDALAPPQPN